MLRKMRVTAHAYGEQAWVTDSQAMDGTCPLYLMQPSVWVVMTDCRRRQGWVVCVIAQLTVMEQFGSCFITTKPVCPPIFY